MEGYQVYGGEGCEARVGVVPNTVSTGNGPLLKQLQASGLGLSVNQYYVGGYLHADDIRTLATSEESLQQQVALVKAFADKNFLGLNINKCEIVMFSRDQSTALPSCEVDGSILPAGDVGKCLGY